MVCTAGLSGVRRPPWEVLPSRRPIVQRPRADCEDDPEPGTHPSRKKGLAQGAAIRRPSRPFYAPDRRGEHAQAFLTGYSGILQADAFSGFGRLYEPGRPAGAITEAACRVGGDVAIPAPHRPGRADFPHPVLQERASLPAT